jgi:2-dehydro-3-deoxygluconokinase
MDKVACFGELLLRMSPVLGRQWIDEASMPVYIGGAELNVATALANWSIPAKYITVLPQHYLSQEIVAHLANKKIDTSGIYFCGERIGTYYLPQGADVKNAGVIYDRAYSSFASLKPGMIDWQQVLEECNWFHFSAISPALNEAAVLVCREALEAAKALGLTISVDLNYRAKLWQYGKSPIEVMPELVQYCQVIMGNIWAAEQLLGIASPIDTSEGKSINELMEGAAKSMLEIHRQYPCATTIAYTFRLAEHYAAVLQHGPEMAIAQQRPIARVVDKVGSGDCFMAGLIYGLQQQLPPQDNINFAAAAAVGKLGEIGDATNQTVEAIIKTI